MIYLILAAIVALVAPVAGVDLDVTPEDVARALTVARGREQERARFHAPYVQAINTDFIEKAEIVTEYRRIVLLAEDHARKGNWMFGYSVSLATQAVSVWKRRLSVVVRMRFHPQNNYVDVPTVDISLDGNAQALIGVLKEPVLAFAPSAPGERHTVLGAVVEGVFDAEAVGQGVREFAVRLNGRELARLKFDLSTID